MRKLAIWEVRDRDGDGRVASTAVVGKCGVAGVQDGRLGAVEPWGVDA